MISGLDISRLKIPTCLPVLDGRAAGDVEAERCFPDPRPRGDNDQVLVVESAGHAVEFDETGVDAGDRPLVLCRFLDFLVCGVGEFARRLEASFDFARGDLENPGLGLLQDLGRALLPFVAPAISSFESWINCLEVAFSRTVFA